MLTPITSQLLRSHRRLYAFLRLPSVQLTARAAVWFLAGLILSAASLGGRALPLSVGLLFACSGWSGVLTALGGAAGYLLFWQSAGYQGVVWMAAGLVVALLLDRRTSRQLPLLAPAVSGLVVSATGVLFQTVLQDTTPVGLYVLRVCLAMGSAWLFIRVVRRRDPILDWLACGLAVLALAQLAPVPWLSFGVIAGGAVAVMGAFPAAALCGIAIDLAAITPVSMTATLCGGYLVRFLPRPPKYLTAIAPCLCYCFLASVQRTFDWQMLPALLVGGILGAVMPGMAKVPARRGETGVAQVRLEMVAAAFLQAQQLLMETEQPPVDEDALVHLASERACSDCSYRSACKDRYRVSQLPGLLLHKPLLTAQELPVVCRKSSRFLAQLHRSQEQLRSIRADRERQQEYRAALVQQYRFLAEYLQSLSDKLAQKPETFYLAFSTKLRIFGNRPEADNGDRVLSFAGPGCLYYVALCDGMGTGMGAVREARTAGQLLRRLLTAGYPADHVLQSLNSLCALRSRAGAVTVDLLEIRLDTGSAKLYKWGAAPSYLLSPRGAEKIGTAGPPPGLSAQDRQDMAYQLSLRRGETLVLVSDGVGEEEALHCCLNMTGAPPEALAESLLTCCTVAGQDDATVALVCLDPGYAPAS